MILSNYLRLRAARENAGLLQDHMADIIGISPGLLRDIESGRMRPSPRVAELLRVAFREEPETLLMPIEIVGQLPAVSVGKVRSARPSRGVAR